jgi:hypothetical protein
VVENNFAGCLTTKCHNHMKLCESYGPYKCFNSQTIIYFFTQPFNIIIRKKLSSVTVLAAKYVVNSSVFGMCFEPSVV